MIIKVLEYADQGCSVSERAKDNLRSIIRAIDKDCSITFEPVRNQVVKALVGFNYQTHSDLSSYLISQFFNDTKFMRIFIATHNSSPFADWIKTERPSAFWGGSNGFISVDYSPDNAKEANQLHELLHLFGANDCYKNNGRAVREECDDDLCVMRWGVNSDQICSEAKKEIGKYLSMSK